MLEDLGIKGGSFLFSHFKIPRKSLDEGLVPLTYHQDVLSLLEYVPSYKEIKVYVEKHTMEVVFSKGKGVVIGEIVEDDKVNKASVDAPVVVVKEQLEKIEHVVDEEIERPRKKKRENEDKSASANILPFGKIKQEDKVKSSLEGREGNERLWFLFASNVVVECFKLLKDLQDDDLEKSREML
uniref:Uncharacterized protein n=1 Tax=Tanacetum cinerariifolium TaxID=118510 RepID=A0A6L2MBJ2_TANCI|nr:hypothetical protein [Tanacetum cinerariifolium]